MELVVVVVWPMKCCGSWEERTSRPWIPNESKSKLKRERWRRRKRKGWSVCKEEGSEGRVVGSSGKGLEEELPHVQIRIKREEEVSIDLHLVRIESLLP